MIQDKQQLRREFARRARNSNLAMKIPMDGNFQSEVAIIGEAGGETEARMGIPFVGGAGKLLWDSLRKFGIKRTDVYISNVVKRQVSLSTKSSIRAAVPSAELQHWRVLLHWELSQLPNLRIIVAAGNVALEAITGLSGINSWRGSVIEKEVGGKPVRIVCVNNPAFAIAEPREEVTFRFHIAKLNRILAGKYKKYEITYHYNPTGKQAIDWIRHVQSEGEKGNPVSYDIETPSNETGCIGLAVDKHEGFCINFRTEFDNLFTLREEKDVRLALSKLFASNRIRLVAQNAQFDSYWLWYKDRLYVRPSWHDTLLAHHTLYPTLPHNLGFLTTQYTDHPFYKDEGKDWKEGGNIDEHWEYNIKDCCITLASSERLELELKAHKLHDFFHNHVMRLQPHLVRMTVGGVLCDKELKDVIAEHMSNETTRLLHEFHELVRTATGEPDYAPNPNSPKQMRELYFSKLKLVGRGTSTDATNRERMALHPRTNDAAKEVIKKVDEYAKVHKFSSTYASSEIDEDERFRCEYKQFGTKEAPGRLSSASVMWGSGCMPIEEAKALTPTGWKRIKDFPPIIAQYNLDGSLEFVDAKWTAQPFTGTVYSYNGRCFRGAFTPNHRIIGVKRNLVNEREAHQASETSYFDVPVTGVLDSGCTFKEDWIRIWVMCSADGSLEGNSWRIRVKKHRKAIRCAALLDVEIPEPDKRGYYNFRVTDKGWNKVLPSPLSLSHESRIHMLDELQHWDAHRRGKSFIYYTTIKINAETILTAAHISGLSASIVVDETNSNEYGNTSTKPLYSVNVSPKSTNGIDGFKWVAQEVQDLEVGCPTVPSGMWLVQYDEGIHVTGNSNLQNQPERARPMFVADPGYGFGYFDLSQAEARVVGWKANIPKWIEQFERAREDGSYDCHRALASEMFDVEYEQVPTKDREDGAPTIRYIAKRCRHGLNYRMGPSRLAEVTGLPLARAEQAYYTYHRITPELRVWWAAVEREVRNNKALFNAFGRRLLFMQRLSDDAALDSIIAFYPQSTIGDKVNRVIYQSEEDEKWPINARIALNVHDALICLAPLAKIKTCLAIMKKYAEEPIMIDGTPLIIPAELKQSQPIGWKEKEDHTIEYSVDPVSGMHRWSGMIGAEL